MMFTRCRKASGSTAPPTGCGDRRGRRWSAGFTLIELIVVMVIISLLLTIAVPRYLDSVARAREAVLLSDLSTMRDAIDKYYGDRARYPDSLQALVTDRYLRKLPADPFTDTETSWLVVPPDDPSKGGVYDVHSGAEGETRDGTPLREL